MPEDLDNPFDNKWLDMQFLNEIVLHPHGIIDNNNTSSNQLNLANDIEYTNDDITLDTFDPDDFFTDYIKKENLTDSDSNISFSSHRSTPSPSESSLSDENYSKNLMKHETTINLQSPLDTPPFSPSTTSSPPFSPTTNISTPPNSPPSYYINSSPHQVGTGNSDSNNFKIFQLGSTAGTLIPIKSVQISTGQNYQNNNQYKKIKIQPKSLNNKTEIGKSNKKTIILSPNDFNALMNKVKMEKAGLIKSEPLNVIKMKPATVIKNEPFVLPKPIIQNTNVPMIDTQFQQIPIVAPTIATNFLSEADARVLKKQQRMIKNRESACLSRKKKKEYVVTLEQQIDQLNSDNNNLRKENIQLKDRLVKFQSLCKCNALRNFTMPSNMKKNVAVLCAMLFVVSLNFGPLNNIMNGPKSIDIAESDTTYTSRHLLFVENNFNGSDTSNSESYVGTLNLSITTKNITQHFPMCEKMYFNQSENIRLVHDLQKWIGISEYKNLSSIETENKLTDKSFEKFLKNNDDLSEIYKQKQKSFWKDKKKMIPRKLKNKPKDVELYREENPIQVFNADYDTIKYSEFFEEIRRRSDTFYVVSFSGDHLLLPALAHNKTFRPKMSLMLPALGLNGKNFLLLTYIIRKSNENINYSQIQILEII